MAIDLDDNAMFGADVMRRSRATQFSQYHSSTRSNTMFVTIISAVRSSTNFYAKTNEGILTRPVPKDRNRWSESLKVQLRLSARTHSMFTVDLGLGLTMDGLVVQVTSKASPQEFVTSVMTPNLAQAARSAQMPINQYLTTNCITGIFVSDRVLNENDFPFAATELYGKYPASIEDTVMKYAEQSMDNAACLFDVSLRMLGCLEGYAIIPMDTDTTQHPELQDTQMQDDNAPIADIDLDLEEDSAVDDFSDESDISSDTSNADTSDQFDEEDFEDEDGQVEEPADGEYEELDGEDLHDVDGEDLHDGEYEDEDGSEEDFIDDTLNAYNADDLTLKNLQLKPRVILIMASNQDAIAHAEELADTHGYNFLIPLSNGTRAKPNQPAKPAGYLREPFETIVETAASLRKDVMVLDTELQTIEDIIVKSAVTTMQDTLEQALYLDQGLVSSDQTYDEAEITLGDFNDPSEGSDAEPTSIRLVDMFDAQAAVVGEYLNIYIRASFPRFYLSQRLAALTLRQMLSYTKRLETQHGVEFVIGFDSSISDLVSNESVTRDIIHAMSVDGREKEEDTVCDFVSVTHGYLAGQGVTPLNGDFDSIPDCLFDDSSAALTMFGNDTDLLLLAVPYVAPETDEE